MTEHFLGAPTATTIDLDPWSVWFLERDAVALVPLVVDATCSTKHRLPAMMPATSVLGLALPYRFGMAGEQGFEPQLPDPESGVLPLDDSPIAAKSSTL